MYLFVVLLLVMSIGIGVNRFIEIDIMLEFKSFSHGYFHLGLSFNEHDTEDPEFIEQEIIIGLFFVNIIAVFYKEKN
jgi:hypothetical protein